MYIYSAYDRQWLKIPKWIYKDWLFSLCKGIFVINQINFTKAMYRDNLYKIYIKSEILYIYFDKKTHKMFVNLICIFVITELFLHTIAFFTDV